MEQTRDSSELNSRGLSDSERQPAGGSFATLRARQSTNFRVAVITNITAVALLLVSTVGSVALWMLGYPVPSVIFGSLSIVDIAWGISEKPWKQLWVANNRIALTESVWIAYLEAKEAIEELGEPKWRLSMLYRAQNAWITRTALIALDDFNADVVGQLADAEPAPPEERESSQSKESADLDGGELQTSQSQFHSYAPAVVDGGPVPEMHAHSVNLGQFPPPSNHSWGAIADFTAMDAITPGERRRRAESAGRDINESVARLARIWGDQATPFVQSLAELVALLEDAPAETTIEVNGWDFEGSLQITGKLDDEEKWVWLEGDWLDELTTLTEGELRQRFGPLRDRTKRVVSMISERIVPEHS